MSLGEVTGNRCAVTDWKRKPHLLRRLTPQPVRHTALGMVCTGADGRMAFAPSGYAADAMAASVPKRQVFEPGDEVQVLFEEPHDEESMVGKRAEVVSVRCSGHLIHVRFSDQFWGIYKPEQLKITQKGKFPPRAEKEVDGEPLRGGWPFAVGDRVRIAVSPALLEQRNVPAHVASRLTAHSSMRVRQAFATAGEPYLQIEEPSGALWHFPQRYFAPATAPEAAQPSPGFKAGDRVTISATAETLLYIGYGPDYARKIAGREGVVDGDAYQRHGAERCDLRFSDGEAVRGIQTMLLKLAPAAEGDDEREAMAAPSPTFDPYSEPLERGDEVMVNGQAGNFLGSTMGPRGPEYLVAMEDRSLFTGLYRESIKLVRKA